MGHQGGGQDHTGRPSTAPELMIRMLIVGYCFGIRSERRLCEEVHLILAYRWFYRLGLEDAVPDHSQLDAMLFERSAISRKPEEAVRHDLAQLRQVQRVSPDVLLK